MTTSRTRKTSSGGGSTTSAPENGGSGTDGAAKKSTKKATKRSSGGSTRTRATAPKAEARRRATGAQVATEGARQLLELTGKEVEGVTGLQRADDGWTVQVEVLEMRRIPDTTDVLALYELDVDDTGSLEGYRRLRRYVRGAPGEE